MCALARKCSRGVTLIEMMTALAIVAILMAIAAPNLSSFFIVNRLDSASSDFLTALNLARSEAMRRRTNVVVEQAAGSELQQWTLGWQIFADRDGDQALGAGDELIRVGQQLNAPLTLYSKRDYPTEIVFTPDGRIAFGTVHPVFIFCYGPQPATSSKQSRSRAVIVNESGRVQLAATNSDGQPMKDSDSDTAPPQVPVADCRNP